MELVPNSVTMVTSWFVTMYKFILMALDFSPVRTRGVCRQKRIRAVLNVEFGQT
jgi:hypothetical protein